MLLAGIYEAFPLTCPQCGAEMRITTLITEAVDVRAIMEHISEPATPPRITQARVRRNGTKASRRMPSMPRHVPLANAAPNSRPSTSTISGCPGDAAL